MIDTLMASLPRRVKRLIKNLVMFAYEREWIYASTVARVSRNWELGAE